MFEEGGLTVWGKGYRRSSVSVECRMDELRLERRYRVRTRRWSPFVGGSWVRSVGS